MNNILQIILLGLQLNEQLLLHPDKLDNLKQNTKVMKEQILRGSNLIVNIRKLSQLEENEISFRKIDICKILKESIESLRIKYPSQIINIQITSPGKEIYIQANDFLMDVFDNILINAVMHNNSPMIDILINISNEKKEGINYIKIEIKDNGRGVEDDRKEKTYQWRDLKEKNIPGMDIKLSLLKVILEKFNGEIWVEDSGLGDFSKEINFIILIPEVN